MAAINYNQIRTLPINEVFQIDFWVGDCFVTTDRRLVGAIELDGMDADSLGKDEHLKIARMADNIYSRIDSEITVTQYYINYTGATVSLKPRPRSFNDTLSKSRESFLNESGLTAGRLYQFFEIKLDDDFNSLSPVSLANNALGALFDKDKRDSLKKRLSIKGAVVLSRRDITEKSDRLNSTMSDVLSYWSMAMNGQTLARPELTGVLEYLTSFLSETLSRSGAIPDRDGGSYLTSGDMSAVSVGGSSAMKHSGESPVFSRIASVTSLGQQPVPGFWFANDQALGNQSCNFIVMLRFRKMSGIQESMFFSSKEQDLARAQLDLVAMATGGNMDYQEKQARMSKKHKDMFKELDDAKAQDVSWTNAQCMVLTFAENAEILRENTRTVKQSLDVMGVKHVWESVGLADAYRVFFPTGATTKFRRIQTNSRQNAVASLYFKPQEGQRIVQDLQDESQFIFQTQSSRPFYFSPFVGGRGLVIGIGPTRSGKTYFKNTLSAHFPKYGGEMVDIDIDPGSEIIAKSLGEDGGIFTMDDAATNGGFNLFSSYRGVGDSRFEAHLSQQLLRMLKANDDPNMQVLGEGEQDQLDKAIRATLDLGKPEFLTLSHLVGHMPPKLKAKFKRWVRSDGKSPAGKYSAFADSAIDGVGDQAKIHKVFNLNAIKSDQNLLSIAYPEIFYRVIRNFEDPERRNIPKALFIDECHHPLNDEWFAEQVVTGAVTWNKYKVNLALWTQSPEQLKPIKKWEAVRSAASTFIFMADQGLDDDLYMDMFKITKGECDAIRSLKPRSEAYIIQRDLDISRKVILKNDPIMHATATSHPTETSIRDPLIEQYGYSKGIEIAAKQIQALGLDTTLEITDEQRDFSEKVENFYT